MDMKVYEVPAVRVAARRWMYLPMLCLVALALTSAQTTWADIIVAEDFSYADGSVGGGEEAGGIGWAGAWGDTSVGPGQFVIESNQAIYKGNGVSGINVHNRDLASPVTVGGLDTLTISFDLIRNETQIGRGVGLNFMNGGSIVFTLGKALNQGVGLFSNGINGAANSTQWADFVTDPTGQTTLTTVLTYDGADTLFSLTDDDETITYALVGQQVTVDAIQLTGYHLATVSNGVDELSLDLVTIPEPTTALLVLVGLGALRLQRRRRG